MSDPISNVAVGGTAQDLVVSTTSQVTVPVEVLESGADVQPFLDAITASIKSALVSIGLPESTIDFITTSIVGGEKAIKIEAGTPSA